MKVPGVVEAMWSGIFLTLVLSSDVSTETGYFVCEDDSKLATDCADLLRDYRENELPFKLGIPMEDLLEAIEQASYSSLLDVSVVAAGAAKTAKGTTLYPAGPILLNGEDALIALGRYAVLADGVSKGVRSDFFAAELVKMVEYGLNLAQSYVVKVELELEEVETLLRSLIWEAHQILVKMRVRGAATLSFFMIDPNRQLAWSATLGDSEVRVLRDGEWWFASDIQIVGNTPFQLHSQNLHTSSKRAQIAQIELMPGDLLLLATDGLWDNLRDERIIEHLQDFNVDYENDAMGESFSMHIGRLSEKARKKSLSSELSCDDSADEIDDCYGYTPDDITIIATYIYNEQ